MLSGEQVFKYRHITSGGTAAPPLFLAATNFLKLTYKKFNYLGFPPPPFLGVCNI